ncbi:glycosyltransferase family 2 protein [Phyllobacterium sophorae]|uniref:Glycosyltransferase n=1 Tax=Phyllobacterium sophorae TaxID=1520277 RepID=A0A2P7BDX9_9HYPH|nr:hypothetical protein [Phyllobacterium sophorae]PSH64662.1 hypothetical protein CU103_12325 [Phyllobacterium sophorae]
MSILLATPTGDEKVCTNYFTSVTRLKPMPDIITLACSLVTIGRNGIVSTFMKGDWETLMFVDSDVGFSPDEFNRVTNTDFDVCAGVYAKRKEGAGFPVHASHVGKVDENGYAETLFAPTGFMAIKRPVFERMFEAGMGKSEIFDTYYDKPRDHYYSEDNAFCLRWRSLGGKIHLDTTCNLTHMGTKDYSANFNDYLTRYRADPASDYGFESQAKVLTKGK